jgi:predicted DNA-binding transcriptional regulator AlpA
MVGAKLGAEPPRVALEDGPAAWKRAGISRAYAYELVAANKFPKPVKIGAASRWVTAEVDAWIEARIAERDGGVRS